MSARMPFMPLSGQPKASSTSGNPPAFAPNQGNPLHRSSAQLTNPNPDTAPRMETDTLPPAGPIGPPKAHRTYSHSGNSAPKNLFQLAGANLSRPQTTAPSHNPLSGPRQTNKSLGMNDDNNAHIDKILSPAPVRVSSEQLPILTSQGLMFKAPALPSHINNFLRDTSPDESMSDSGFSNAHILSGMHPQHQDGGTPVRQQPTPDESGVSNEMMQADHSSLFRTSTPHKHRNGQTQENIHGFEPSMVGPQRVFPQTYGPDDAYSQIYAQQQQVSTNRKHTRDRYATDGDPAQPAKRQRNSTSGRSMYTSASNSGDSLEQFPRPVSATPQSNTWQDLFGFDGDKMLRDQAEHFHNRVSIWQGATEEEWIAGGEELVHRLQNILQKTQDFMKRKQALFTDLEGKVIKHQDLLEDRRKALNAARDSLLNDSQSVIGGQDPK